MNVRERDRERDRESLCVREITTHTHMPYTPSLYLFAFSASVRSHFFPLSSLVMDRVDGLFFFRSSSQHCPAVSNNSRYHIRFELKHAIALAKPLKQRSLALN